MMSFEAALEMMKEWEGAIDNRDKARFAAFVTEDQLHHLDLSLVPGAVHEPQEWTEENILKQLREDAKFGLEKALAKRGISADCMVNVIEMWCKILENNLESGDYNDYGVSFIESVINHYGWQGEM